MLTVSGLARRYGLSRSTLLYYEAIGLLKPAARTPGNYRSYGERDAERLERICLYRNTGLALRDIRALLDRPDRDAAAILQRRLREIEREIESLRRHQSLIVSLIRDRNSFRRRRVMTKESWKAIMKASGFTEEDTQRWHVQFERSAPDDHQQFLEFLHIPPAEIRSIRDWSRKGAA